MRSTCLTAVLVALVLASSLVAAPPDLEALIRQLDDAEYAKRQAAMKQLEEVGDAAVERLRQTLKGPGDPDVRLRAGLILRAIADRGYSELRVMQGKPGGYWLNRVVFTADGKQVIASGGAVIWYDAETGKEVRRALEVNGARPGLALSSDGKHILTGHAANPALVLIETGTGKEAKQFTGHKLGILAVALSPDGTTAASAGQDGLLVLWDATGGKEKLRLTGFRDRVASLAFSPDGKLLASGHQGAGSVFAIHLWDVATGKEVRACMGHKGAVYRVRFLPDGKTLVSASADGTLRLWDVETGKELRQMKHAGSVYDVAVSPDGTRALSAGFDDRTVRLWDLASGKEVHRFEGHATRVLGVAFSPDGKRAASSDANCTIHIWQLGN
jgi:WD40 repeat protein